MSVREIIPLCRCGLARHHVDHHGPEERAEQPWLSEPKASYGGLDYYTWAGVVYHPYEPDPDSLTEIFVPGKGSGEYKRGYQAGYHAGLRRSSRDPTP